MSGNTFNKIEPAMRGCTSGSPHSCYNRQIARADIDDRQSSCATRDCVTATTRQRDFLTIINASQ